MVDNILLLKLLGSKFDDPFVGVLSQNLQVVLQGVFILLIVLDRNPSVLTEIHLPDCQNKLDIVLFHHLYQIELQTLDPT